MSAWIHYTDATGIYPHRTIEQATELRDAAKAEKRGYRWMVCNVGHGATLLTDTL